MEQAQVSVSQCRISCFANTNKILRIVLLFLVFLSLSLNILYILQSYYKTRQPVSNANKEQLVITDEVLISQSPTQQKPNNLLIKQDYLSKEYRLLTGSNDFAESKLFGFKFNQFHQDWQCNPEDMVFTDEGVTVTCRQKPCSISTQNQIVESLPVDQKMSDECFAELENREFPNSILSSFDIKVSPVYLESGQTLADAVGFTPNKTTLDGLFYQFNENTSSDNRETGWSKKYEITFYSPKTLSDKLSQYGGTYFGSEEIYAKYQVEVGFYETEDEDRMNIETQFNSLISRLIDSMTFLK